MFAEAERLFRRAWRTLVADPRGALRLCVAFFRGTRYVLQYRLFRKDVRIQMPFFAFTRVRIHGPGKVRIGGYCFAYPNVFEGVTITTLSPMAQLHIGRSVSLGGVTIRCWNKIDLKDRSMTANCLIQDGIFVYPDCFPLWTQQSKRHEQIVIEENTWVGFSSCILEGTHIGRDSVIAEGAVCFRKTIAPYHLAIGNPINRSIAIDHFRKFRGDTC